MARLSALGAEVECVDPGFNDPLETFNTLWFAGAARLAGQLDSAQRDLLDPGLQRIAVLGEGISLKDYSSALEARAALVAQMSDFHQRYDILVTPMLPITAFAAGHNVPPNSHYHEWMHWTPFSYPFNLTQQPAASVPCGLADNGLPVGLQVVGDVPLTLYVPQAELAQYQQLAAVSSCMPAFWAHWMALAGPCVLT